MGDLLPNEWVESVISASNVSVISASAVYAVRLNFQAPFLNQFPVWVDG